MSTPVALFILAVASAYYIVLLSIFFRPSTKEKRNGRHRETPADTQDTEAATGAGDSADAYLARYLAFPSGALSSATSYTTGVAGYGPKLVPVKAGLEVVESDMPILAHRSARLHLDGTSKHFGTVTSKGEFGVDADAWCTVAEHHARRIGIEPHAAPDPDCRCGFYALPTDLAPTYESAAYVTLMVELSGTVIECERGFRAEHQRVVECQIPPCPFCGNEAELVVVHEYQMQMATCAAHKPIDEPGVVYVSVRDVANMLSVPVTAERMVGR